MTKRRNVAVIGAGEATPALAQTAYETGRAIAGEKWVLLCGGLGGVMEAAARGASEAGGIVVGILPGGNPNDANPFLTITLPTGLGHARNAVIATAADAAIAVGGEYGTLSEMALALKMGKPVAAIGSWNSIPGVHSAKDPAGAVRFVKERIA